MIGNKFIKIGLFFAFLAVTTVIYQRYYRPSELAPIKPTGKTVEIKMCARKNQWFFDPNRPEVNVGDKVILKIFNEDTYDHGWALDIFGKNVRLSPRRETVIEFVPTRVGEFPFYCSVPCGEGHYRQRGVLIVKPQGEEALVQAPSRPCE